MLLSCELRSEDARPLISLSSVAHSLSPEPAACAAVPATAMASAVLTNRFMSTCTPEEREFLGMGILVGGGKALRCTWSSPAGGGVSKRIPGLARAVRGRVSRESRNVHCTSCLSAIGCLQL